MTDTMPVRKGNLDVLVLKSLSWDEMHGFEILEWLEQRSGGRLDIDDSAIYQALHRLEERELIDAEWGVSDKNRRVRLPAHREGASAASLRQRAMGRVRGRIARHPARHTQARVSSVSALRSCAAVFAGSSGIRPFGLTNSSASWTTRSRRISRRVPSSSRSSGVRPIRREPKRCGGSAIRRPCGSNLLDPPRTATSAFVHANA